MMKNNPLISFDHSDNKLVIIEDAAFVFDP